MNTEQAGIGHVLKQTQLLRSKVETLRGRLMRHIDNLKGDVEALEMAQKVEYTPYSILLKRVDDGFVCLGIVDTRNVPEDAPEEFDLALPIPTPESLPDFGGW